MGYMLAYIYTLNNPLSRFVSQAFPHQGQILPTTRSGSSRCSQRRGHRCRHRCRCSLDPCAGGEQPPPHSPPPGPRKFCIGGRGIIVCRRHLCSILSPALPHLLLFPLSSAASGPSGCGALSWFHIILAAHAGIPHHGGGGSSGTAPPSTPAGWLWCVVLCQQPTRPFATTTQRSTALGCTCCTAASVVAQ